MRQRSFRVPEGGTISYGATPCAFFNPNHPPPPPPPGSLARADLGVSGWFPVPNVGVLVGQVSGVGFWISENWGVGFQVWIDSRRRRRNETTCLAATAPLTAAARSEIDTNYLTGGVGRAHVDPVVSEPLVERPFLSGPRPRARSRGRLYRGTSLDCQWLHRPQWPQWLNSTGLQVSGIEV